MPKSNSPVESSQNRNGFTLVELIATIAIIALLVAVMVPFIGNYVAEAKRTADRQTLAVLNDALTRYKTQGGDLSALTAGASIGNVITALQTPVSWAGMEHQFLKTGTTYTAASLSAINDGAQYKFTRYGDYADGTEYSNGILSTYTADGYDVGDEAEFKNWLAEAMAETGTTNYLALTNPDTTDRFGLYARVASSGDKVRVWWGDGTTQDYDSISTSSGTEISKVFTGATKRTVVIVGNVSYVYSKDDAGLGGVGATAFGGDIATMGSLTALSVSGSNTLSGDVSLLTNLTELTAWGGNTLTGSISGMGEMNILSVGGSNTLTGSVTGLTGLTYLYALGSNTLSGDVSSLPLQYLKLGGNSTIDVDSIVNASLAATGLTRFELYNNYTLSQTQVDTILANFWTNKDAAKPRPNERAIDINASTHAAPSAAGLTIKTNLQAYMSPNNTGPMVWTVETN